MDDGFFTCLIDLYGVEAITEAVSILDKPNVSTANPVALSYTVKSGPLPMMSGAQSMTGTLRSSTASSSRISPATLRPEMTASTTLHLMTVSLLTISKTIPSKPKTTSSIQASCSAMWPRKQIPTTASTLHGGQLCADYSLHGPSN